MTILDERDRTLIDTLKSEARVCPVCEFDVRNPFAERCPRCYAKLPSLPVECPGCMHRFSCPMVDLRPIDVSTGTIEIAEDK